MTNTMHIDTFGTMHADPSCEEFHAPNLGTIPADSEEAKRRVGCADCLD